MPRDSRVWDENQSRHRSLWRNLPPIQGVTLVGLIATAVVVTISILPPTASAGVNSDKAQIAQLQQQIEQDGTTLQRLVAGYDQAQAHEIAVQAQIAALAARLAADQQAKAKATAILRNIAVSNYMSGVDQSSVLAEFEARSAGSLPALQEYAQVAAGRLQNAIDAVAVDVQQTQSTEAQLRVEQAQAEASIEQLDAARQGAQSSLDEDNALLDQVQGNLQSLLQAAAQQSAAAEQEEEENLAAQAVAATVRPVNVSYIPSAGGYTNPLRGVNALSPERVDQGVDYSGYGPIYAIGNGVVLSTTNSGWPGDTFISYRLTEGPAGGLVVYAAEDIYPLVQVGQSVTAGTVLGTMYEGPDGIETGWADPSGDGVTMARDAGQFSGSNSTAFGANFSELLASIGAPPGVLQNSPPTGSLPQGWPTW